MAPALLGAIALTACISLETPALPHVPALPPLSATAAAWKDFEAGNFDSARSAFQRQTEAHPDDPAGHYGLGRVALAQGERELAVSHLERALALDGTSAETWAYLGTAQLQLERNPEAHTSLQKALSLDPQQGQALVSMAEYAATVEVDYDKALRHLELAKAAGFPAIPPDLEPALRNRLN